MVLMIFIEMDRSSQFNLRRWYNQIVTVQSNRLKPEKISTWSGKTGESYQTGQLDWSI